MAHNTTIQLSTMKQLQKLLPDILKKQYQNKKLQKAALSNPIFALESLGYKISDDLNQEIEDRVRFNLKDQKKLIRLRLNINEITGKKVNLSSAASISDALSQTIKTKNKNAVGKTLDLAAIIKAATTPLESRLFNFNIKADALTAFKGFHSVVPLMIEYRKIQASAPQLASKKTFDKILNDDTSESGINIKNVKFILKDKNNSKSNNLDNN
jgi:hypothetical protein